MQRLLTTTTALSLFLSPMGANPALSQIVTENGSLIAADGTLLCDITVQQVCNPADYAAQAAAIEQQIKAAKEGQVQPEGSAAPAEAVQPEGSAAPAETVQPEGSAAPAEAVQPEGSAAPAEAVQPEGSAAPAEAVQPEGSAAPAEAVQPEGSAAPAEAVQPEGSAAPAEAVQPEGSAAPAEAVQPEASGAPAEQPKAAESLAPVQAETTTAAPAAPSPENLPANMRLTNDGSLLGLDGSVLCDAAVLGACDPSLYRDQADRIEKLENLPRNMILTNDGSLLALDNSLLCDIAIAPPCNPADYVDAAQAVADRLMAEQQAAKPVEPQPQPQAATAPAGLDASAPIEALRKAQISAEEQGAVAQILGRPEEAAAHFAEADRLKAMILSKEEQQAGGVPAGQTAEVLPANMIRSGDGSLLAEDRSILCDAQIVTVCNVADHVARADAITAQLKAQAGAPKDAEISLPSAPVADPSAGLLTATPTVDPNATPVEVVAPQKTELAALGEILVAPPATAGTADVAGQPQVAAALAGVSGTATTAPADAPVAPVVPVPPVPVAELPAPKDAKVVIETLSEATVRRSSEEFAAAPVALADGRQTGLTDFQKVGLIALGALAVGAIINEGRKEERRVVSNTGDRVVVLKPDGSYQIYKDDDTVLRRPGSTVRTEAFADGSTRTIVQRLDGSQVVTIRDASGRVLRRAHYDPSGRERLLIDDFVEERPIVVQELPRPPKKRVAMSSKDNSELGAALATLGADQLTRRFSLRQVRETPQLRALAPELEVDRVTFDSGSAVIRAKEAARLADLGRMMQDILERDPAEVFLIEGHTDATGHAAMNLTLSDRRAESVALALTEYFDIPPENMVVQGYGESELLVPTELNEPRNRRVAVRLITRLIARGQP